MSIKRPVEFHILTLFPTILDSYVQESMIKRAITKKILKVVVHNIRDFSLARHQQADDKPYGGGPGMVMQIEPIIRAVEKVNQHLAKRKKSGKIRTILFSTRGKKLTTSVAKRLSKYDHLIFICGRYEGVDERVAHYVADEELSIGDYVLSGGELPAMVTLEAVSRFVPGFLGTYESLEEIKGSYPVYTRPAIFYPRGKKGKKSKRGWHVPAVLLSGDHKKIEAWRDSFRKK